MLFKKVNIDSLLLKEFFLNFFFIIIYYNFIIISIENFSKIVCYIIGNAEKWHHDNMIIT